MGTARSRQDTWQITHSDKLFVLVWISMTFEITWAFPEIFSDERLLRTMHKDRATSKFIPVEAKQASKLWLARQETVD